MQRESIRLAFDMDLTFSTVEHMQAVRLFHNCTTVRTIVWSTKWLLQWNLSIKDTLNNGHLSNEDTVCSPYHTELCTNLPLN